jgi:hypothetical protein
MIDHLLRFTDENEAQTTLPSYYTAPSDDSAGCWRGGICIPGVGVYEITGTQTITDADTGQSYTQETRQAFPGWWIVIALPALDPDLRDLPGGECRLIADREAAARGDANFLLYVAPERKKRSYGSGTFIKRLIVSPTS